MCIIMCVYVNFEYIYVFICLCLCALLSVYLGKLIHQCSYALGWCSAHIGYRLLPHCNKFEVGFQGGANSVIYCITSNRYYSFSSFHNCI